MVQTRSCCWRYWAEKHAQFGLDISTGTNQDPDYVRWKRLRFRIAYGLRKAWWNRQECSPTLGQTSRLIATDTNQRSDSEWQLPMTEGKAWTIWLDIKIRSCTSYMYYLCSFMWLRPGRSLRPYRRWYTCRCFPTVAPQKSMIATSIRPILRTSKKVFTRKDKTESRKWSKLEDSGCLDTSHGAVVGRTTPESFQPWRLMHTWTRMIETRSSPDELWATQPDTQYEPKTGANWQSRGKGNALEKCTPFMIMIMINWYLCMRGRVLAINLHI